MTPERIRAIRESLGLTKLQAARLLGVSDRAWRHWETGARPVDGPALRMLLVLGEWPNFVRVLELVDQRLRRPVLDQHAGPPP